MQLIYGKLKQKLADPKVYERIKQKLLASDMQMSALLEEIRQIEVEKLVEIVEDYK